MKHYTFRKTRMILLLAASVSMVSACSSQGGDKSVSSATPVASGGSAVTAAPEPLGKYAEPVVVTEVLGFSTPEDPRTTKGITPDQNSYLKDLKDMLNIDVKYKWTVPKDQYEQKFSLALASGDLPDIMELSPKDYEKLRKQDMLADLTAAYDKYASPDLKKYMESDGGFAMKTVTRDGKLMAIPDFTDPALGTQLLWIRKDWLDNLNLQVPKTIDELEKVATAFVNDDPDRNGKKDTYGIALEKKPFFWGFDLRGFFNAYGAYPSVGDNINAWIKDSSGKLVPGLIQPEMKPALAKLQSWYKNGILDKEFALKDENKVVEDITAGKVGISYGEWWYPNWPLNLSVDKDPKANWIAVQIPTLDGQPGKSIVPKLRSEKVYAVNKKLKNPEAIVKMLNFYLEMGKPQYMDKNKPENGYVYNWFMPRISNPAQIETIYTEVNKALAAKQTKITVNSPDYKMIQDVLKATLDLQANDTQTASRGVNWGLYFSRAAEDGGWGLTRKIREKGQFVVNEFYGTPTPTMVEKGGQLDKLMLESFNKIILGAPVDDFDKFVASWKTLGGDKMTEEVNAWYNEQAVK
ncbi:extracellular solute-binding protein [Paenibacillus oleatilyticus]|uniref:extracellular solute-binding protein n=1 Tax=Paenibacillus oleatilyticus TaxID=2594886 RepID=UPI001C1F5A61|nr:extracellular solute-binding protein [Paenibacillus oleatilyticus]MBU7320249.1 extracellular solute-binding protein [Paenibacillus oleatilyticus]